MAEPCTLADLMKLDIRSTGVAGLLLIVEGVWGAARSYFFLPRSLQADSRLRLVPRSAQTRKVKSQAVLLIVPEFIPRRRKHSCVLILHRKLSISLPPQLSSQHQRSNPKVSQPREPQGTSGTSVYRKGDGPERCERAPHFPGCTFRACRQGSKVPLRANNTHLAACWGTVYGGS